MRYLITAKVKPDQAAALRDAIAGETLGQGSIAEGEYLRNMSLARQRADGRVQWVEVCFCGSLSRRSGPTGRSTSTCPACRTPTRASKCRDLYGNEPWACGDCDCTARLEQRMEEWGRPFLEALEAEDGAAEPSSTGTIRPRSRQRRGVRT